MKMTGLRFSGGLLLLGLAGALGLVRMAKASDHQDTPEVEINSRCDINDVYAFPGSSDDRICLVMTTSSPIAPSAANPAFDTDKLYQIKIDNTGDANEDLVLQFTFEGSGAGQEVTLRGPVAPLTLGTSNRVVTASGTPNLTGRINTNLGAAGDIQLFAGLRDDPFFLDLEQFFRIVPDRKPVSGALSQLPNTPTATAFRNPAPDYLRGFNCLALVVELPKSRLTGAGTGRIGVWGTISR